jgi:hypothetical protein
VSGEADNLSEAEGATPKTALVFLIFLVAGPPVGILFVWAMTIVLGYILGASATLDLSAHLRTFGVFAVASYMFGGAQALFVACVAAVVQSMSHAGLVPFRPVLAACLLASVAYPAFTIATNQSPPPWDMLLAMIGLHVGGGMLCWLICNAILWPFRRRSANQVMA